MNYRRGFIVTGELLVAGVFFFLVGVFGFNFFTDDQAPTTVSIEPQSDTFSINEAIILDIFVITRIPFNAIDLSLDFPIDQVEVVTVAFDESVIDVWVNLPSYSNNDGTVSMTGGTTRKGGIVGKSPIATVILRPLKPGAVNIDFTHSLVLAHDDEGTDLQEDIIDTNFIISELANPDQANVIKRTETKEYVVSPELIHATDINQDGKTTLTDLSVFMSGLGGEYIKDHDFNQDGTVGLKDLSILMSKILAN